MLKNCIHFAASPKKPKIQSPKSSPAKLTKENIEPVPAKQVGKYFCFKIAKKPNDTMCPKRSAELFFMFILVSVFIYRRTWWQPVTQKLSIFILGTKSKECPTSLNISECLNSLNALLALRILECLVRQSVVHVRIRKRLTWIPHLYYEGSMGSEKVQKYQISRIAFLNPA